jgi:hypothetical protein
MQPGQVLRDARLSRGIDLYEVKRVTKISVPALRAMEEDRWDDVPAPGPEALLEVYAEFLGVDREAMLADPPSRRARGDGHLREILLAIGLAAAVGVVIGLIGLGSGGGGSEVTTPPVITRPAPTTPAAPVSVQITTHALVWVCLEDQSGRRVINGLNLVRDQTVGPYEGDSFEVAFGNGKVDLTVNGAPVNIPNIAAPFGYRITPGGSTRLRPAAEPSCT